MKKKLTIVVPVLGQHEMVRMMLRHLLSNIEDQRTNIVVVDNGGDFTLSASEDKDQRITLERRLDMETGKAVNMGVYPVFQYAMNFLNNSVDGEIVAFFHSDLIIVEKGFDKRILQYFESVPELGLMGFVGSNEIDASGGRGLGTTSNFQGGTYYGEEDSQWSGSPGRVHGAVNPGLTKAAVVDGCAMIISRTAWKRIGFREDFPPHHFYDRLICTQVLEAGFSIGVLGIACDHLSGQTVCRESKYHDLAAEWCRTHVSPDRYAGNPQNPAWDQTVYQEAERMWLGEYRDEKHLVPIRV